jgi:hypothetical protein
MREREIEEYLVRRVEQHHGHAYKFCSPSRRNVPDRMCVLPGGVLFFVEVKAPGKRPTAGQLREMKRISRRGQLVFWVASKDKVDEVIGLARVFNVLRRGW